MAGDWTTQLLTTFLGSGAALAVGRVVIDLRKEFVQRKDSAGYLALQIAFNLEGYSIKCAKDLSNHRISVESQGHAGTRINAIPAPIPFSESDAYKLLDRSILNEIMDFPQRCMMAQESAGYWWDIAGDEDEYSFAVEEGTVRMGVLAAELAKRIRRVHGLDHRQLSFDNWDIDKFYLQQQVRIRDEETRRQKAAEEINELMSTVRKERE